MADVKKMATREGYGRGLVALGAAHEDVVVLDADLAGSTKTGMFAKAYPDRHFNCGIAEADMMCVAAGFAANGFVPFASSFAMFAAGRAFEQIRNSIGYPHLNVKIGATHGGLSVGEDGASHQCCEDFALMRSIPGMVVICPADGVEAEAATKAAYEYQGPVYLRMGRLAIPVFHEDGFEFKIGKGEILRENRLALCQPVGLRNKILPPVTNHGRGTAAAGNHDGNQFRSGSQRNNLQTDHGSGSGRNRDPFLILVCEGSIWIKIFLTIELPPKSLMMNVQCGGKFGMQSVKNCVLIREIGLEQSFHLYSGLA